MTSKRTAFVCWGPKRFNEMKTGLIQRQPGRQVPNNTHTHTHTHSGTVDVMWKVCGGSIEINNANINRSRHTHISIHTSVLAGRVAERV